MKNKLKTSMPLIPATRSFLSIQAKKMFLLPQTCCPFAHSPPKKSKIPLPNSYLRHCNV